MQRNTVTFDFDAKEFVLDAFDKAIDEAGYVVEKGNPAERVMTPEGEELQAANFAGIHKGSLVFVRTGVMSAIKLSDRLG